MNTHTLLHLAVHIALNSNPPILRERRLVPRPLGSIEGSPRRVLGRRASIAERVASELFGHPPQLYRGGA